MSDADKPLVWLRGQVKYRIDADAIAIVDVFEKRTQTTPAQTISRCRQRLSAYDQI